MITEMNGSNFRFVRIKKQEYQRKGATNCMIQVHDISKSIMFDQIQNEKQLYEIINATVSHEMRNPINSMVYQNKNISFLLQEVVTQIGELKTTPTMKKKIKKIKRKALEMQRSSSVMKQSSKLLLFFVQDLLDFA